VHLESPTVKNVLATVALASFISAACRAASPPLVPENLLACRKLPGESERVHCYDSQIDRMSAVAASSPAGVQTGPTAPKTAATPAGATAPRNEPPAHVTSSQVASTAGFGQETLPPAARPQTSPRDEPALLSSITAMRPAGRATYAISLANGQVWRQEEASDVSLFFRVGDGVRIEKAALGSYHMSTATTGTKNWVRVTRIQ
jgi:hypothetical protein